MLYFPQIFSDVLFPLDCDQPQMRVANGSSASHARGEGGGGEEEEKKKNPNKTGAGEMSDSPGACLVLTCGKRWAKKVFTHGDPPDTIVPVGASGLSWTTTSFACC